MNELRMIIRNQIKDANNNQLKTKNIEKWKMLLEMNLTKTINAFTCI